MTEDEWLKATHVDAMLACLVKRASERKLLLFSTACSRRVWNHLDSANRRVVEMLERYADGIANREEVEQAYRGGGWPGMPFELSDVSAAAADAKDAREMLDGDSSEKEELRQIELLHCIFDNPYRPVVWDAIWCTREVLAVAKTVYEENRFVDLPILADALEEAGYQEREGLRHCREDKTHAKGCWLVDMILGKT